MQKQDLIEIKIEDMLDDGRCFARVGGFAVFVSGGVYGDIVKAEVIKVKKSFAEAKILEVVKPSEFRTQNDCKYMNRCGGCTLRELRYDEQLLLKRKNVISKLERIAGIENPKVNDVIGAETKNSYRNKAVFAVGKCGEVGFMKAKSNHVLDICDCRIQKDTAMVCAEALREYENNLEKNSNIRKMTVKTAVGTGEVMVCLESDVLEIPGVEELVNILDNAVYEVDASLESVAIIMPGRDKFEKDVKVEIIAGKRTIKDKIIRPDGRIIEFEISPLSFYQVNSEQMIKLYDKTMEYAGLTGKETLLDIYCGVGTIGIYMADKAARVIGIESVKPAVIDANRNSVINGIINTRYICGKAEDVLPDLFSTADSADSKITDTYFRDDLLLQNKTVAILDPPRSGCDSALLDALIENKVDKIVYVSCDPGTLARDIKILGEGGYDFVEATPVDMFPYTSSIESVALLRKNDSDKEASFSIKYHFFDKAHETEMSMLVDGSNILSFERKGRQMTTKWNLDELLCWLQDFLDNMKDDPYPVDVSGSYAAIKDINAREFDSTDVEEFDAYYDKLDEWNLRHRWHTASAGGILADIYLQLVGDYVEISWNNQESEEEVTFKYHLGGIRIPKEKFVSEVESFLEAYRNYWS